MYFNCKLTGKYQKAHADSTISENVNINDLSDNQRKRKFKKKKEQKKKGSKYIQPLFKGV